MMAMYRKSMRPPRVAPDLTATPTPYTSTDTLAMFRRMRICRASGGDSEVI